MWYSAALGMVREMASLSPVPNQNHGSPIIWVVEFWHIGQVTLCWPHGVNVIHRLDISVKLVHQNGGRLVIHFPKCSHYWFHSVLKKPTGRAYGWTFIGTFGYSCLTGRKHDHVQIAHYFHAPLFAQGKQAIFILALVAGHGQIGFCEVFIV